MTDPNIPPDVLADLEAAARYAATGEGDPETLQRITQRAEKVRQEVYQRQGQLDIGVDILRGLREGEA